MILSMQDSLAAVAHARLSPDLIIIIPERAIPMFVKFGLCTHKVFVKGAHGTTIG